MMKIYFTSVLVTFALLTAYGQNIPIDFETDGNGADWTWRVFENVDNPDLEIIENPDPTGINTSATVAKFTARQTGAPFAGCETTHGQDIGTYNIDASNSIIRILVWKSVISDVGIKLVAFDGASLGEIKMSNTLINQWEELVFDFSGQTAITYDQIVIFPDFASRAQDNIIYFDNVWGGVTTSTTDLAPVAAQIKLFPNPATSSLTLQSDELIAQYEVYSLSGQSVARGIVNSQRCEVNINALATGTYLLKATDGNGQTTTRKFIKD
jgi:hypothetical protein